MVKVSRWGKPGLEGGDWVMLGEKNLSNYLKSGKWQFFGSNQFAKYGSGSTFSVPKASLQKVENDPTRFIKNFLGQRMYKP